MTYIDYLNQFWRIDTERPFEASDTRLYFYLLKCCNELAWKNPFGHSDRHLALYTGVSIETIRKSKKRLQDRGLIEIILPAKPARGISGQTKYKILTVLNNSTDSNLTVLKYSTDASTVHSTVSSTVPSTNNRKEKNKQIEVIKHTYPSIDEVKKYFEDKQYNNGELFYNFYSESKWINTKGRPVINWKQTALGWFKPENKITTSARLDEFKPQPLHR